MADRPPRVAVVIPTKDHSDMVTSLLLELARQSLAADEFEVIVVDDCSTDDTASVVAEIAQRVPYPVHVLRTPANRGPAAARNMGWQHTEAPMVAFIDDDCSPDADWLAAGLEAFAPTDVGVVQGRTRVPEGATIHRMTDWYLWRVVDGPTPFFEGCNLFFRHSVLDQTGGFDEEIRYYGEDCAAGWRALDAGYAHAFAANASVSHPVERRGFRWFVRNGLLESRLVHCASKHPGFRRAAFWQPWAYRREDPAFVVALAGVVIAVWQPVALLLLLPYAWWRRPSVRHLSFFRLCVQVPIVDAARVAGHLGGSLRHRIFVL